MSGTPQTASREPALDGVRGFAMILVLAWHCFYLNPTSALIEIYTRFLNLGFIGLDIFFVLSGFLITRILINDRGNGGYFGRFYLRRVFRIFPAYYLSLALIWLFVPTLNPELRESRMLDQWPYFVAHIQNWDMAFNGVNYDWAGVHHFWSLAIEEQFYLVWPFVVMSLSLAGLRRVCIVMIVGSVTLKLALVAMEAPWSYVYLLTPSRLEGLAYGAFIASLTGDSIARWKPWITAAGYAGFIGLAVMVAVGGHMMSALTLAFGIPAATAAFGWLIFSLRQRTTSPTVLRVLRNGTLVWFGQYSYAIYLCHYAIYWTLRLHVDQWLRLDGQPTPNLVLLMIGTVTVLLSVAFAKLMFALVESPSMKWRDRLQDRWFAPKPPAGMERPERA